MLLIGITVTMSVLFYAYSMGLLGALQPPPRQAGSEHLIIENIAFSADGAASLTVRNIGTNETKVGAIYVDGNLAYSSPQGVKIHIGEAVTFSLPNVTPTQHNFKVTTLNGSGVSVYGPENIFFAGILTGSSATTTAAATSTTTSDPSTTTMIHTSTYTLTNTWTSTNQVTYTTTYATATQTSVSSSTVTYLVCYKNNGDQVDCGSGAAKTTVTTSSVTTITQFSTQSTTQTTTSGTTTTGTTTLTTQTTITTTVTSALSPFLLILLMFTPLLLRSREAASPVRNARREVV
jgi:hypothetical protein